MLISRNQAILGGKKRYFTGLACPNGHVSERYVSTMSCVSCNSEKRKSQLVAQKTADPVGFAAKHKVRQDRYREKNRDVLLEKTRNWQHENRDKTSTALQKWRRNNPEKARALNLNRKARLKGAEGYYTAEDVMSLFEQQNGQCKYCCRPFFECGYHVDHRMPLALGGTNWPKNLQLLCPSCNCKKNATHPDDYEASLRVVDAYGLARLGQSLASGDETFLKGVTYHGS